MLPKNVFIFLFVLTSLSLNAQQDHYITQRSKGFIFGYGLYNERISDNSRYHVTQVIYNFSIPLLKKEKVKHSNICLQIEPQVNPVFTHNRKAEIEAGLTFGFILNHELTKNTILDVGVGNGPSYISKETNFQSKGYVFSNYILVGISKRIRGKSSDWELILQGRFRHISNAGMARPNYGIDNIIVYIGFSKII